MGCRDHKVGMGALVAAFRAQEALEAQVQAANQRAERLRSALTRAQEALNALNEALQEISPQGTKTQQAPTSGGGQTSPAK
jgi:predicted  nucleic acid-binding Zn-ribbon protein